MKNIKSFLIPVICFGFLISGTSCAVFEKKDNGKHKGWSKNINNPHNSASKKQSGKSRSKS